MEQETDGDQPSGRGAFLCSGRAEEEEEQMLFIPTGVSHIVTSSVSTVGQRGDGSSEAFTQTLRIFLDFKR